MLFANPFGKMKTDALSCRIKLLRTLAAKSFCA